MIEERAEEGPGVVYLFFKRVHVSCEIDLVVVATLVVSGL